MKCANNKLGKLLPSQVWPWFACFLIWAAVLWWLSSAPRHFPIGEEVIGIDKVYHFGYYLIGALALGGAVLRRKPQFARPILIIATIISLCGIFDEFHQSFVKGRSGNDPADWTADTLGGIAGAWLAYRFLRPNKISL